MRPTIKDISEFNTIIVSNNLPSNIEVKQPTTKIVEITTAGPRGKRGEKGDSIFSEIFPGVYSTTNNIEITGSLSVLGPVDFDLYRIITGSISAEVNVTENIFLIKSGSDNYLNITEDTTTLTNKIFLIKNKNNESLFKIDNGIFYFQTQSVELNNNVEAGAFYFTSSSFFVSLE
jgi:hypothetical protein